MSMKKIIPTLVCLAFVSACSAEPPARVKPDLGPVSKMSLDVLTVSLVDHSGIQPANSPYNTNHFQPTITESIRQWATDSLQAVGTAGTATVIIKDASLTSQAVPHSDDWFTREQSTKYVAHAEVDVEIKGRGENYAMVSAQASRFETLPENPTEAERKNAYTNVLNSLMRDLGQNLDTALHEHAQNFLITAPIMTPSPMPMPASH